MEKNCEPDLAAPKPKKKVKKVVKKKGKTVDKTGIAYREETDFKTLDDLSVLLRDIDKVPDRICLTNKEKKCLEEIVQLAGKTRAPLDDRLVHYYKKDVEKIPVVSRVETEPICKEEVEKAAAVTQEPIDEVSATVKLHSYLTDLKKLIAKREVAWAAAQERDYEQKSEIFRLRNEVGHLRTICSKRSTAVSDKEKMIAQKDKIIAGLKAEVLHLAKNQPDDLPMLPEVKTVLKIPGPQVRRNFGPAALLANSLNKARRLV